MPALPWIIGGLAWPHLLTVPPWPGTWLVLFVLSAGCAGLVAGGFSLPFTGRAKDRAIRKDPFPGLLLGLVWTFAAGAWSCWHIERQLDLRLYRILAPTPVVGRIATLPARLGRTLRFEFIADGGPWGNGARRIAVHWYQPAIAPRPGERWILPLRLVPPRGRLNFSGGDSERFLFAARLHAIGTVKGTGARRLSDPSGIRLSRFRDSLRRALDARLDGLPGGGLVRALGMGERSGLSDALRDAMRSTGTGHLLAISGLHVGMVAVFGFGCARLSLAPLGCRFARLPPQCLAVLAGFIAAAVYAALAGFGTSPRRALVMLAVASLAMLLRRRLAPFRAWCLALCVVLLLDPLAPLVAGFWLSFCAVAVLLFRFAGRPPLRGGGRALWCAQWALTLVMGPLAMAWFQWLTLAALPVNLLAIPWVSFVTLPLVLLALLGLPFDGPVAEVLPDMAARSAHALERTLVFIDHRVEALAWHTARPGPVALTLGVVGGFLCLLPAALRLRRFGVLLLLPTLLPPAKDLRAGDLRLELLDVGQGQAALVSTREHLLLADTGPGHPGRWDLVDAVVAPAVRAAAMNRPDLVMVSHGDLDHAGGLAGLRRLWPGTGVTGNTRHRPADMAPCTSDRAWSWDGVAFRVLHPSPWLPYRGNDSSCVLQLLAPGGRMLLPGDIGQIVERRLARRRDAGGHRLLVVPHHGSRTSSSEALLDWARPEVVLIPAGWGNRFGIPDAAVLDRLTARGIPAAGTAECGALRFTLRADGRLESDSARHARRGFWRFPAAPHCPGQQSPPSLTSVEAFRYHAGHTDKNFVSKE